MDNREGIWTIRWHEFGESTWLYGSTISFAKNKVEFDNPLIAPGTVIKTWRSQTNYQGNRIEPSLPIIDGERSYKISLDADTDIPDGLLLRFKFFQKNGQQESELVVRGTEKTFRCPIRTYSYIVELICAGSHHFVFRHMTLEEL